MPILDPPLLELVLIVCCYLLELSLTFVYNSVHFKNKVVVGNSKNPVKRQIHYKMQTDLKPLKNSVSAISQFLPSNLILVHCYVC